MLITFFHFFFFNDTATTEIYTLSLHDALPIYLPPGAGGRNARHEADCSMPGLSSEQRLLTDRRVSDRRSGVERRSSERRKTLTLRSEEHTSELQSRLHLVCRLLLEKKK